MHFPEQIFYACFRILPAFVESYEETIVKPYCLFNCFLIGKQTEKFHIQSLFVHAFVEPYPSPLPPPEKKNRREGLGTATRMLYLYMVIILP